MTDTYRFRETHRFPAAAVTPAYMAKLFCLAGKLNTAPFRGFAPGEVLFRGASCARRGTDGWEITFRFVVSPDVTELARGNVTKINHTKQIYSYGDFSLLGIGA